MRVFLTVALTLTFSTTVLAEEKPTEPKATLLTHKGCIEAPQSISRLFTDVERDCEKYMTPKGEVFNCLTPSEQYEIIATKDKAACEYAEKNMLHQAQRVKESFNLQETLAVYQKQVASLGKVVFADEVFLEKVKKAPEGKFDLQTEIKKSPGKCQIFGKDIERGICENGYTYEVVFDDEFLLLSEKPEKDCLYKDVIAMRKDGNKAFQVVNASLLCRDYLTMQQSVRAVCDNEPMTKLEIEKAGPLLAEQVRHPGIRYLLTNLDMRQSIETIVQLGLNHGFEKCDLIEMIKPDESH